MTSPLVFVCTYISYSEIENPTQEFKQKWGSLYLEFKNDKGFFSSQYYFIYFTRRVVYVISQVFLNSFLELQGGLNIIFSLISLGFLAYYQPFKERSLLYSNLIGELATTLVMVLTYCYLWEMSIEVQENLEISIISIVLCSMAIQIIISIYIFAKSLYRIWKKAEKTRALEILRLAEKRESLQRIGYNN